MRIALEHCKGLVPRDGRHLHHIEAPFKKAAGRFVPKVVEAKILDLSSLNGNVVGFLYRFDRDWENPAIEGLREDLKGGNGTRGERNVATRAISSCH